MAVVGSSSSQHAASSSGTTTISNYPYRVFLSFRGPDTRYTFADHLYTALESAGIRTFRDDDEIEKGKRIDSEIKSAINASQSSVIVFSENFASSRWCLEEVAMIMNREKSTNGRSNNYYVLPVFYHVKPTEVRRQTGNFGNAFAGFESKFKEGRTSADVGSEEEWIGIVSGWRDALTEAATLSGMEFFDGSEAKFIEKIVAEIQGKVKSKTLSMPKHLTGIYHKVRKINNWLCDGSENVSYMAICGIGGIGKTTVARHAFNLNCNKFSGSCFLSNVREAFENSGGRGLNNLQRQLISDISNHKNSKILDADDGISKIKDAVWGKKVLLVLDDVEEDEQLECLLGDLDIFCEGSKIMITTRSRNLLKDYAPTIHNVEAMDTSDSILLFSRHAFKKDKPDEVFADSSNKMIQQCEGLPLALKVFGSLLFGKDDSYWKAALAKLQAAPDAKIFQILQISYDALNNEHDKELFLEISCFFVEQSKQNLIFILDPSFHATVGLENLKDRCLLEFDERGLLVMHQMVRDMGREICRKENPNNPGKRRRVRNYSDSLKILEEKKGTSTIEGLVLDVLDVLLQNMDNDNNEIWQNVAREKYLETVAFEKMQKLRVLHITFLGGLKLKGSYKNFPKKIRNLNLDAWPLTSLPDDFPVDKCVSIVIRFSRLTKLGLAGTKVCGSLKLLDLSLNRGLIRSPDFSRFPNLVTLNLSGCVNLKEVDKSIGMLKNSLKNLYLENCTSLRKLPRSIVMLHILQNLIISGCTKLEEFPENMEQMKSLKRLQASRIIMNQEVIITPRILVDETSRHAIKRAVPCAALPGSLRVLFLSSCGLSNNCFPRSFDNIPLLEYLYLGDNPIRFLPECIKSLTLLKTISFYKCERLESLVELPEVSTLDIGDCVSLKQVTYQVGAGLKTETITLGCGQLIWLEHKYKPIPIKSIGNYLLDTFSFIDWEVMEHTHITFYNNTSAVYREGPIQGVEEADGILSISFPGSQVPPTLSHSSCHTHSMKWDIDDEWSIEFLHTMKWDIDAEGSIYFLRVSVPSCHPQSASSNKYDVTLCFVYNSTDVMRQRHMDGSCHAYTCVILNICKRLALVFHPSWNGYNVEESDEELDITWVVSNWILGTDKLQSGDELSIYSYGKLMKVKKIGCHIRGIDTSQQVPTQTTPHQYCVEAVEHRIFKYGNPDIGFYVGPWMSEGQG